MPARYVQLCPVTDAVALYYDPTDGTPMRMRVVCLALDDAGEVRPLIFGEFGVEEPDATNLVDVHAFGDLTEAEAVERCRLAWRQRERPTPRSSCGSCCGCDDCRVRVRAEVERVTSALTPEARRALLADLASA